MDSPPEQKSRTADAKAVFIRRLRRAGIFVVCAGYILVTLHFGIRHVLGDSLSHPLAYFFTWDMFPGYRTESSRRTVIGVTREDKAVQLLPAVSHRFRTGINRDVPRIDIDKNPRNLLPAVEDALKNYNRLHAAAPIRNVFVVDRYWPSRFNLPDDLYRQAYAEPNPRRRYWRLAELNITPDEAGAGAVRRSRKP